MEVSVYSLYTINFEWSSCSCLCKFWQIESFVLPYWFCEVNCECWKKMNIEIPLACCWRHILVPINTRRWFSCCTNSPIAALVLDNRCIVLYTHTNLNLYLSIYIYLYKYTLYTRRQLWYGRNYQLKFVHTHWLNRVLLDNKAPAGFVFTKQEITCRLGSKQNIKRFPPLSLSLHSPSSNLPPRYKHLLWFLQRPTLLILLFIDI